MYAALRQLPSPTGCDNIQKAKNVTARRAKTGASVLCDRYGPRVGWLGRLGLARFSYHDNQLDWPPKKGSPPPPWRGRSRGSP